MLLTAGGTAKLADVGFSKQKTHTYLSDVPLVGTFAWVAPEVLLGNQQCTLAVDVYSFGIVLWVRAARRIAKLHAAAAVLVVVRPGHSHPTPATVLRRRL